MLQREITLSIAVKEAGSVNEEWGNFNYRTKSETLLTLLAERNSFMGIINLYGEHSKSKEKYEHLQKAKFSLLLTAKDNMCNGAPENCFSLISFYRYIP